MRKKTIMVKLRKDFWFKEWDQVGSATRKNTRSVY